MKFKIEPEFSIELGTVKSYIKRNNGIDISFELEKAEITLFNDELFRIRITQGNEFETDISESVETEPESSVDVDIEENNNDIIIVTKSKNLKIIIAKLDFVISAFRGDGSKIMETGTDLELSPYFTMNNNWRLNLKRDSQDVFVGFGEKTGALNKSARLLKMENTDILSPQSSGITSLDDAEKADPRTDARSTCYDPYYISIPFYYVISGDDKHHAAGFFFDNPYPMYFDLENPNEYNCECTGGQMTLYVFAGPKMSDILKNYTNLTGRMEVPPMWALGNHQCRWKKYNEEDTYFLAEKHRDNKVPCDTLWLDIDYMDEYRVFSWNKSLFPDVKRLTDNLLKNKFRLITIIDPGVKYDLEYKPFVDGFKNNYFCKCENGSLFMGKVWPGRTVYPDFSKKDVRTWWGKLNGKHVKDSGLAGIWNDMNEPAVEKTNSEDMMFGRNDKKHSHYRFHNEYALLMAKGTVEGLKESFPNKRTFVLSRAGSPGIQRYAANWLGDNFSRWEHLWQSIPMSAGLSISGQPFIGADVGGFAGATNPELLARWIQYGVLTPFCRNHNMNNLDQEAWTNGKAVLDIYRNAVNMRYKILPYIYTSFVKSSETGCPIQRPLIYDYQNDVTVYDINDEYLFGENMLIAPICKPAQTSRNVYLPQGDWYDYHNDTFFNGNSYVLSEAPMNKIPIFVKSGSVIPTYTEKIQSTMDYYPENIELNVYIPEINGEYISELREDDGETFDYKKGLFIHTTITVVRNNNSLIINTNQTGKGFEKFIRKGFNLNLHGNKKNLAIKFNNEILLSKD